MKKASGDDDLPVEVYEACVEARTDLYSVIRRLLKEGNEEGDQEFPAQLVSVLFVMLWKGAKKGTVNEFEAYRPIGLMRHACKLADMVFVEELAEDTELFLDPHQEGSRKNRGARGNILRARLFIDTALGLGQEGVLGTVSPAGLHRSLRCFLTEVSGQCDRRGGSTIGAASVLPPANEGGDRTGEDETSRRERSA